MRAAPNTTRVAGLVTTSPAEWAATGVDRAATQTRINNEIPTVFLMRVTPFGLDRSTTLVCGQKQHGLCQRSLTSRFFIVLPYIARSHSIPEMQFFVQFPFRRVKACERSFSVLCKFRKCKRFHTWVPNYPLHQDHYESWCRSSRQRFL